MKILIASFLCALLLGLVAYRRDSHCIYVRNAPFTELQSYENLPPAYPTNCQINGWGMTEMKGYRTSVWPGNPLIHAQCKEQHE